MEERREKRRTRRMARLYAHGKAVACILFGFIILLALASLIAKDRAFSDDENRGLAQRPAITLDGLRDGSFFGEYSSYLADQFFGRDAWISLDTFGIRLLGRHDVNGVYVGKDGYLFSPPDGPVETIRDRKAGAINTFVQKHDDLNVMAMVVPSASAILDEELPGSAPLRNQRSDIADAVSRLDSSVQVLDVTPTLLEHKREEIYYRTDHHWTSLGAYYGFLSAADRLGPDVQVPSFNALTVSDSFQGTLASRSGIHRAEDEVQVYIPQDTGIEYYVNYPDTQTRSTSMFVSAALDAKDKYTVFFGGNHPLVEIWTTADIGRNLLVFKDSYANCFMQFLTSYYDRIIMLDPRYYYGELSTVLSTYGITDVLFLYNGDTWMTDTSLADVLATG